MELMRTLNRIVDPAHTALIIVDAQDAFCSPRAALPAKSNIDTSRVEAAVPRLNKFIKDCRNSGVKVVWIRQVLAENTMLPNQKAFLLDEKDNIWYDKENTPETDWYAKMERPIAEETIITKRSYDAFQDTDLHLQLQCIGIKTLLMTGFVSNVCVESTARHGFFKGYYIVAVSDCTDAYSKQEYESTMFNIREFFGQVVTSEEIAAIWQSNK